MKTKESFTSKVKEELVSISYESKDRLRAFLAGYIRINGLIHFSNKKTILTLSTENAKTSKFIYQTINEIYDAHAHLQIVSKTQLSKKAFYTVIIDDASEAIIDDLEISFLEGKISKNIVKSDETIAGYLAGAFLASGSVNSPITSNYHLEIATNNENYAKWLSKLFGKYKNTNIEPKIIKRRNNFIIYLKKSDQIADFLIMTGAVSSCLEFEDIRANRDLINNANRLTNMDTANMKKTYETGLRQIKEINLINQKIGLDSLSNKKMALLCKIRLDNESATLNDLAKILSDKLGENVSKSNINHLFRKIHGLAENISI